MFEELIVDQNPHWNGAIYPDGVRREVLATIKNYLKLPHVICLVGVRRAGKSTLLRQMINYLICDKKVSPQNILFLNLENPQFNRYRNDVAYLDQAYNDYVKLADPQGVVYCFLDEVHFFPQWQVFVKDRYERKGVKFIVTGSNSRLLSAELITLLSGRSLPIEIYPFSFAEYVLAQGVVVNNAIDLTRERNRLRRLFDNYLQRGGFPEISSITELTTQKDILSMYARNILYQDIVPRFALKKAIELENMFFYLASNVGKLYSFNKLSAVIGISDKTIKEYLSYFSAAYLLFSVNSFSFSAGEQIKSPKKIYAIDTGLAGAAGYSFSENRGRLLENQIFLALKRSGTELFYYKTANNYEVDFACTVGGKVHHLIQVAYDMHDDKTREREIRALMKALDETGLNTGTIVTYEQDDELMLQGKKINIISAQRFLYANSNIVGENYAVEQH